MVVANLQRETSVEDLTGTLRKLGRTPSEAEFYEFIRRTELVAENKLAATSGDASLTRVESLDLLRDLFQKSSSFASFAQFSADIPESLLQQQQQAQAQNEPATAGAGGSAPYRFDASYRGQPTDPKQTTGQHPESQPSWSHSADSGDHGNAGLRSDKNNSNVDANSDAQLAEAQPAPSQPGPGNSSSLDHEDKPAPVEDTGAAVEDTGAHSSHSDSEGEGAGATTEQPQTKEEIRRMRRMISNRESARRSRRRKLEHVECLSDQIKRLKSDNSALMERVRGVERRYHEMLMENNQIKQERDILEGQLRIVTRGPVPSKQVGQMGQVPQQMQQQAACSLSSATMPDNLPDPFQGAGRQMDAIRQSVGDQFERPATNGAMTNGAMNGSQHDQMPGGAPLEAIHLPGFTASRSFLQSQAQFHSRLAAMTQAQAQFAAHSGGSIAGGAGPLPAAAGALGNLQNVNSSLRHGNMHHQQMR